MESLKSWKIIFFYLTQVMGLIYCTNKIKFVFRDFRGSVEYSRLHVLCVFTGSKLRTSYGLYSWYSLSSLDTL